MLNLRTTIYVLTVIFITNTIGIYLDWYDYFWFDIVLHFSGGLFTALLFAAYLKPHLFPKTKLANIIIIVGATMMIGVVWEFAEYFAHETFSESASAALGIRVDFMGNLDDTITDLLMDMLGALLAAKLSLEFLFRANKARA